jgi:hypothetical protein
MSLRSPTKSSSTKLLRQSLKKKRPKKKFYQEKGDAILVIDHSDMKESFMQFDETMSLLTGIDEGQS